MDRLTYRQIDIQEDGQLYKQTDRQIDKQTDRQKYRKGTKNYQYLDIVRNFVFLVCKGLSNNIYKELKIV